MLMSRSYTEEDRTYPDTIWSFGTKEGRSSRDNTARTNTQLLIVCSTTSKASSELHIPITWLALANIAHVILDNVFSAPIWSHATFKTTLQLKHGLPTFLIMKLQRAMSDFRACSEAFFD